MQEVHTDGTPVSTFLPLAHLYDAVHYQEFGGEGIEGSS